MDRRRAGFVLLGLLAGSALPRVVHAQQPGKVYRIGYLSAPSRESVERGVEAFLKALRDLGWIEGQNLVVEFRWANGKVERLPELAAEMVRLNVDVIVAPAGSAVQAAKNATSTIPIVMIFPNDPVASGLVASLARPGGNVTGTTFTSGPEIFGKQLQLLKEAVPRASRVAVLGNPSDPEWAAHAIEVETAARALGLRLQQLEARGPEEFDSASPRWHGSEQGRCWSREARRSWCTGLDLPNSRSRHTCRRCSASGKASRPAGSWPTR